ncbi:uncharacterized protein B0I36DRAFT_319329 [Microdochium trichocladiopsis]|uniref:Uncharacterized protein n=1 Tax=Microdochium trichocladiopsis TaxID=1682393 RepID=A0A9P8YF77_9PEZI|nr:uncharacterized protein B0I36DRAFT_319329 [Microdochium trichocladiopsis]KAH7035907.1 hypothetical protein B0I36DRAFT_319329 [Microdochium trichocladiopsis]
MATQLLACSFGACRAVGGGGLLEGETWICDLGCWRSSSAAYERRHLMLVMPGRPTGGRGLDGGYGVRRACSRGAQSGGGD